MQGLRIFKLVCNFFAAVIGFLSGGFSAILALPELLFLLINVPNNIGLVGLWLFIPGILGLLLPVTTIALSFNSFSIAEHQTRKKYAASEGIACTLLIAVPVIMLFTMALMMDGNFEGLTIRLVCRERRIRRSSAVRPAHNILPACC